MRKGTPRVRAEQSRGAIPNSEVVGIWLFVVHLFLETSIFLFSINLYPFYLLAFLYLALSLSICSAPSTELGDEPACAGTHSSEHPLVDVLCSQMPCKPTGTAEGLVIKPASVVTPQSGNRTLSAPGKSAQPTQTPPRDQRLTFVILISLVLFSFTTLKQYASSGFNPYVGIILCSFFNF